MLLSLLQSHAGSQLMCKNPNGEDAQWFAAFKFPKIKDSNEYHQLGTGFMYYDPYEGFIEPKGSMETETSNPFYNTLKPVYGDNVSIGHILFNDQPPPSGKGASSTYAHMKGVLIFDKNSAIYLEHSCPRWPPASSEGYDFSKNAKTNGQSFMCISFGSDFLETISKNLLISRPYVYDYYLPEWADENNAPELNNLINKRWNEEVHQVKTQFKVDNKDVYLFTKSKDYGKDLYSDYIAPEMKSDIYVETWMNGPSHLKMSPICDNKYKTLNVNNIRMNGVFWKRTKDHSKWALGNDFICISGTNRQSSQTERGGSAFCVKDSNLVSKIHESIAYYEDCNGENISLNEPRPIIEPDPKIKEENEKDKETSQAGGEAKNIPEKREYSKDESDMAKEESATVEKKDKDKFGIIIGAVIGGFAVLTVVNVAVLVVLLRNRREKNDSEESEYIEEEEAVEESNDQISTLKTIDEL